MKSTLGELILEGVTTNVDFLYEILNDNKFEKGEFTTAFIEERFQCQD